MAGMKVAPFTEKASDVNEIAYIGMHVRFTAPSGSTITGVLWGAHWEDDRHMMFEVGTPSGHVDGEHVIDNAATVTLWNP